VKLSDFSIRHPVTIVMIVLLALLLGGVSLTRLAIDLLPEMNFPVAAVITSYEGAGPQEIENLITRPLEETMGTVNNVRSITSSSSSGSSIVIVEFNWGADMNFTTLEMREKVDMIRRFLPSDASSPLVFKFDPSVMPVMQLGVGGTQDIAAVKKYADDVLKARLERLDGVASVTVSGGLDRAILINLQPDTLVAYGLAPAQIAQALMAQNLNLPGGTIEDGRTDLLIRTVGEFRSIEDIANIPIASPQGFIVRLGDMAEIKDDYRDPAQVNLLNGEPAVAMAVQKQTDANPVQVARLVQQELRVLQSENPDISFTTIMDQSIFVERSIGVLGRSAINGAFLAIIVLFLFLRSFRSTLIIGLAIPISVITTFVLVHFAGLTLNMLSLGGLALGVGMLVDNAIVVLESIFRFRQDGYGATEAARLGSQGVGKAITASTLTTVVVFLPVVYVEGFASIVFKEMALTVIFALLMSLLVSLTLIPMLASRLMARPLRQQQVEKGMIARLTARYQRALAWALKRRKLSVLAGVLVMLFGLVLIPFLGTEFLPTVDQSRLTVDIRLPVGSRLTETRQTTAEVTRLVEALPELETIFTTMGGAGVGTLSSSAQPHRARLDVKIVNRADRNRRTADVVEELREKLKQVPGARISVAEVDMFMGGGFGSDPIVVKLKGDNLDILRDLADQAVTRIESVPGTREVSSSFTAGRPELQVVIDKDKAITYGMTVYQAAAAVRANISGQVATRYRLAGDEIDVLVQLEPETMETVEDLKWMPVVTPLGSTIPLNDIASFRYEQGPVSIAREDQSRVVDVRVGVFGRDLGSVNADVAAQMNEINLPRGYTIEYGGQNQEMWDAFGDLFFAFGLAIVLVYMVMASQFESLVYPLTIMFSVPFALVGVVGSLVITGRTINIPSVIGIIMLAGIVVNNAIVLVDYINQLRDQGEERLSAIITAGGTRLRPILMTTLTTVLGLFPMSLGFGDGSELLAPLATVVIGGLLFSTLLTLFFIPVLYSLLDDAGKRLFGLERKAAVSGGER
jgi:hydrophobic/amphiphilic exporter-1 (mainly G- bacteria), HAE1 family